ncbi:hypothetical protein I4N53_001152 [Thermoanaerobacter sp. AC272]|uniref:hypothetical protein n=1 Tax=Thermoanaerobacter sp. CM-CNRG TB177 TaxID=2800659 RepID=UPI001BDEC94C|nr:hypothetical protein [Thermoanaerobacter sp. CM-CNRG TB177]MBT1279309.1 hypothetical protein [Thermoanaerobacter sp. CM-CNRG TB177]
MKDDTGYTILWKGGYRKNEIHKADVAGTKTKQANADNLFVGTGTGNLDGNTHFQVMAIKRHPWP